MPSKELKAMKCMCIVIRSNKKFASFSMELSMRIDLHSSRSYVTTAMVAADVSSAIANTAELSDGLVQAPVDSVPTDTSAALGIR